MKCCAMMISQKSNLNTCLCLLLFWLIVTPQRVLADSVMNPRERGGFSNTMIW